MAKFIQGNELNLGVENIIKDAEQLLLIVSPYIKLHPRYKDCLLKHKSSPKFHIVIVFGKNEGDITKSIPKEEIEFFSSFPNIEIKYEERLHAKFYANERSSLITSMNLYDYSQNNNIEAGIFMETHILDNISKSRSLDEQAFDYFLDVSENCELLFKKEPKFEKGIMGFKKKYVESIITENKIEDIIKGKKTERPKQKVQNEGYCIACGKDIKLNPKVPYCKSCYSEWQKHKNKLNKEQYCHICVDENKSSLSRPACINCYRKYKTKLEFPS